MKKVLVAAAASVIALSSVAVAHDPPGYLNAVFQWPESALPILDGNLAEWDVIPAEFWLTEQDLVQSSERADVYTGPLDVSSIAVRMITTWNEETNRTYWGMERFDDHSSGGSSDDLEGVLDADHSGGTFWDLADQSAEEIARQRGRHAQTHHWYFDAGFSEVWTWFWMTQADWYDDPQYTAEAHSVIGEVGSDGELTQFAEWYQIYWDDFNWEDPAGSVVHDFEVDEIIGLAYHLYDGDLRDGSEDCNCWSRWALSPNVASFGDADFLADFVLLPVDDSIEFVTAVEDDSWGRIKASLAR